MTWLRRSSKETRVDSSGGSRGGLLLGFEYHQGDDRHNDAAEDRAEDGTARRELQELGIRWPPRPENFDLSAKSRRVEDDADCKRGHQQRQRQVDPLERPGVTRDVDQGAA